jgi:hypothetical protein
VECADEAQIASDKEAAAVLPFEGVGPAVSASHAVDRGVTLFTHMGLDERRRRRAGDVERLFAGVDCWL